MIVLDTKASKNSLLLQLMSTMIKKGDLVSVIDEDIQGTVVSVSENILLILDQNGFERSYNKKELVKYDTLLSKDSSTIRKHPVQKKKKTISKEIKNSLVIDLHHNRPSTIQHTILESQLRKFKLHVNKAIRSRAGMITFIVGVGEGILRKNIESALKKNHIKYCDAPYHTYGNGAIEVHLTGVYNTIK